MKNFCYLPLALVLALSLFTACDGNNSNSTNPPASQSGDSNPANTSKSNPNNDPSETPGGNGKISGVAWPDEFVPGKDPVFGRPLGNWRGEIDYSSCPLNFSYDPAFKTAQVSSAAGSMKTYNLVSIVGTTITVKYDGREYTLCTDYKLSDDGKKLTLTGIGVPDKDFCDFFEGLPLTLSNKGLGQK